MENDKLVKRQFDVVSVIAILLVLALIVFAATGIYFEKMTFETVFQRLYEILLMVVGWLLRELAVRKGPSV